MYLHGCFLYVCLTGFWCLWRWEEDVRASGTRLQTVVCCCGAGSQSPILEELPVLLVFETSQEWSFFCFFVFCKRVSCDPSQAQTMCRRDWPWTDSPTSASWVLVLKLQPWRIERSSSLLPMSAVDPSPQFLRDDSPGRKVLPSFSGLLIHPTSHLLYVVLPTWRAAISATVLLRQSHEKTFWFYFLKQLWLESLSLLSFSFPPISIPHFPYLRLI